MKAILLVSGIYLCLPADPVLEEKVVLVEAIRQAEDSKFWQVGRAGERSEFQITRDVWYIWSHLPFECASVIHYQCDARSVALAQVESIYHQILNPSPFRVAVAWNAGIGAVQRGEISDGSINFGHRVKNLYEEMMRMERINYTPPFISETTSRNGTH